MCLVCMYWSATFLVKPSTQIDENRELTVGVSERQISGYRFMSDLLFSAVLRWATEKPGKIPDLASEFRWTPLAAAQRIRNLIFGSVRAIAVWNLTIKNGRKTPKGGQCRWKRKERKLSFGAENNSHASVQTVFSFA